MTKLQRNIIATDMERLVDLCERAATRLQKSIAEGNTEKAERAKASVKTHSSELAAYNRILYILGYHPEWTYHEDGDYETVAIVKNE